MARVLATNAIDIPENRIYNIYGGLLQFFSIDACLPVSPIFVDIMEVYHYENWGK